MIAIEKGDGQADPFFVSIGLRIPFSTARLPYAGADPKAERGGNLCEARLRLGKEHPVTAMLRRS